uniref:glutathione transferase n=1 Tax=Leersia perrieri TaxID=77586 RepID=A0A0D9V124_9ORYZ
MVAVKVFGPAKSTGVARVLVCLEEVGTEYELVRVHLPTGEHKSPAHLARNPFGQVPAFQDGDLILFESRAIAKYVLRKSASELLRESNISESAMVDVWLEVESQTFDKAMSAITFQCLTLPIFMGGKPDKKIVEANLEKLKKALEVYEARLCSSRYLAGDFISLADLSHFPMAHYLLATPHASVLDAYPHVKSWIAGLLQRPSVRRTEGKKSMAPVKVFGPAMSTNVARILVCLEEVGAEYEIVPVDMPTGEHKRPPHISRNPFGQVPAFQDGDLTLFESRPISKYILRKGGSDLLRESNLSESAKVDVWLEVESKHFDSAMSPIIFQCFIVPMFMGATDMEVVNENIEKLKKALEVYEVQLSKFKYLAGHFISLADISHFPAVYYLLASAHASVLEAYPHVKPWIADIMQRPSLKKVTELMKMSSA